MAAGIPLADEERAPWLERLRGLVAESLAREEDMVLAASALKQRYRERLTVDPERVQWVYLSAPREVIASRLASRTGHFMPPSLLDSQLAALEVPEDALQVDVTPDPDTVVQTIRSQLGV
jgi:gluconokinase